MLVDTLHNSIYIILYLFSKLANSSAPLLAAVSLSILDGLLRLDCALHPTIRSAALGLHLEQTAGPSTTTIQIQASSPCHSHCCFDPVLTTHPWRLIPDLLAILDQPHAGWILKASLLLKSGQHHSALVPEHHHFLQTVLV